MSVVDKITRESWILGAFPEWGTWLAEEIDAEKVEPGTVAMWWIGCTGIWFKSEANCNIAVDLWFGNGKQEFNSPPMKKYHQMRNMTDGVMNQPNRRANPIVFDPFAIKEIDAVMATHYHRDHIDPNMAAAVLQNCSKDVPFIGPQRAVDIWVEWGVPVERCQVVKPGDIIKIKDIEIVVLGDQDNDVSMFKVAGKSVAMADASKLAREAANEITRDHENDGVAYWLENNILFMK